MIARLSIRLRLTLWYSAVLLLGLLLFAAGLWFSLEQRLLVGVDARLAQRVEGLRTVLEVESVENAPVRIDVELAEFAREVPEGALIELRDSAGALLLPANGKPLFNLRPSSPAPEYRTAVRDGRSFRLLVTRFLFAGRQYDVLVAASLDEVLGVMRVFRNLLLFMIPAVLAAACLGGYWISRRALAPVDAITRVARSISVQNLSRRLDVPRTGDELQRMSETWNEVLARLDGAFSRIRQFTADASHELRTPVALIRATAELALRRDRSPQDYRKALLDIQQESERMTRLTESLLTLARADSNALELPLAPLDLNPIVEGVVRQSSAAAQSLGLRLQARTAPGSAVVLADETGIRQLLLVLLDNALKHTPPGGEVTVSTAARPDGVQLSVQDSGDGIPAEALPHIFERFFRLDPARSPGSGTGLGLSIAQLIAQAHGAQITVRSAPGEGSNFSLALASPSAISPPS